MKQRTALLACVLGSLLSVPAQAQFTITSTDLGAALSVGNQFSQTRHEFTAATMPQVELGRASAAAQTWNFSAIPTLQGAASNSDNVVIRDKAAAPRQEYFPGAGLAFASKAFNSFLSLRPDGLVEEGWTTLKSNGDVQGVYRTANDGAFLLMLPATYGATLARHDSTFALESPSGQGAITTSRTLSLRVDGFGTATFPDGVAEPALRLVRDQTITRYVPGKPVQTYDALSVVFVTASFRHLEFFLPLGTSHVEGSVRVETINFIAPRPGLSTGIETPVAADFGMDAPFPNPARASVVVPYRLDASGRVTLAAYDALGRQVALLVQGVQPAGDAEARLDVSGWTPGVYVLRLVAGGATQTRLLTVL